MEQTPNDFASRALETPSSRERVLDHHWVIYERCVLSYEALNAHGFANDVIIAAPPCLMHRLFLGVAARPVVTCGRQLCAFRNSTSASQGVWQHEHKTRIELAHLEPWQQNALEKRFLCNRKELGVTVYPRLSFTIVIALRLFSCLENSASQDGLSFSGSEKCEICDQSKRSLSTRRDKP